VIIDRIVEEETPHRGHIVGSDIPLGDLPIRGAVDVGVGGAWTLQLEGAGRYHLFNRIDLAKQDLIHFQIGADVLSMGISGNPLILFFTIGGTVLVFLVHTDIVFEIEPIIGKHLLERRGLTKSNLLIF
jgi:hypothetical protein